MEGRVVPYLVTE